MKEGRGERGGREENTTSRNHKTARTCTRARSLYSRGAAARGALAGCLCCRCICVLRTLYTPYDACAVSPPKKEKAFTRRGSYCLCAGTAGHGDSMVHAATLWPRCIKFLRSTGQSPRRGFPLWETAYLSSGNLPPHSDRHQINTKRSA